MDPLVRCLCLKFLSSGFKGSTKAKDHKVHILVIINTTAKYWLLSEKERIQHIPNILNHELSYQFDVFLTEDVNKIIHKSIVIIK